MKIFIITMDDPLYTLPFLKDIIKERQQDICGVALVKKGNRVSVQKHQSKILYLVTLIIILGPILYSQNVLRTLNYKLKCFLSRYLKFIKSPSIIRMAEEMSIPTFTVNTPNNVRFLSSLKKIAPDVIINQSQSIIKKELLSIPKIGVINRHNALLPKNRGRLTPFWVKYKKEKETGVSIHFLTDKIDAGEIIYQESFKVNPRDSIRKIVNRNYKVAHVAMLKALDKLENGDKDYIKNDDSISTYNTIPSLKDALRYRFGNKNDT